MTRSIRTEWLKLRTIRMPWGLLGLAAGLTVLVTVLGAARAGGGGHMEIAPLYTRAGLTEIITRTGHGMLLAMVLG